MAAPAGFLASHPVSDSDMWHDLWIACALVLVIEGVWPFLSPGGMRRALLFAAAQDDRSLRTAGLLSMLAGLALLYLVN